MCVRPNGAALNQMRNDLIQWWGSEISIKWFCIQGASGNGFMEPLCLTTPGCDVNSVSSKRPAGWQRAVVVRWLLNVICLRRLHGYELINVCSWPPVRLQPRILNQRLSNRLSVLSPLLYICNIHIYMCICAYTFNIYMFVYIRHVQIKIYWNAFLSFHE